MEAKRNTLGGTKTCRVHDMLRDLCLKKAKEENFMQLISMNGSQHSDSSVGKKYRLCVHSPKQNFIQLRPFASHVHSLLFFATNITHNNGSYDISSIVQDSQLLRVLDLESIRASTFPRGIDLLVCLNYLALKGNITSVPSSIARLWNLETLIVKGTWGEIVLPSTLWSMTSLRHVHIRPRASLTLSSPELENAIELENLTTFSSPTFYYWIKDRMIVKRWTRLKKLRCIFWVLQELWDRDRRRYIVPTMEFLTQLESLNVSYIGKNCPCKLGFPLNLKKLTLSKFCFTWDYMAVIVKLSKLEVLKLLFNAFVGDTWYMTDETIFPKLKVLKLENLKLEKWNNSMDCPEHFPELERLVLRSCRKLAEVPSSFGEVLTLQTIEVQWCTKSAANSVKTILEQQKEWDNQDFEATITPSEWDFRNPACL